MKRGDLIFFYPRKNSIIQKLIAYFDGKYCHTGILLSEDLVLSVSYLGVKIQSLSDYNRQKFDVYRILCSDRKKEEMIKFLIGKMDSVRYDYLGVLRYIFRWIFDIPQRFYCSEFICWGLFYIGLLPEKLQLSPLQLSNQNFLEKIEI